MVSYARANACRVTYMFKEALQFLRSLPFFAFHAGSPDSCIARLNLPTAPWSGSFALLVWRLPFSTRPALRSCQYTHDIVCRDTGYSTESRRDRHHMEPQWHIILTLFDLGDVHRRPVLQTPTKCRPKTPTNESWITNEIRTHTLLLLPCLSSLLSPGPDFRLFVSAIL